MPNDPRSFGLGDFAVENAFYDQHVVPLDTLRLLAAPGWVLPAEFDARSRKWVTPAKNQGSCGSCWAHAAVGVMESKLLKQGYPAYDLSEQQQISCNTVMKGCCGGSGQSLMFYITNRPWSEAEVPYCESTTSCPIQRTKGSSDFVGIEGIRYLANGFYAVEKTKDAMKQSLVSDGPFYFRYDVYDDFYTYWEDGTPQDTYVQTRGIKKGGHAVLLIGWSDARNAWLIKNSWGPDAGPNKDGTFWIRYTGHSNDLQFQGFNLSGITPTSL